MIHIKMKKKRDRTIISHKMKKEEQINQIELDILKKCDIPSLLQPQLMSSVLGDKICFTVRNMVDLASFFRSGLSFSVFLDVIQKVVHTILECEGHGIRISNLELVPERIFYQYDTKEVRMLFWPLISLDEYPDIKSCFQDMGQCYICREEDQPYYEKYAQLFMGRERFRLNEFKKKLDIIESSWKEQQKESDLKSYERQLQSDLKQSRKKEYSTPILDLDATVSLVSPSLLRIATNERIDLKRFPFSVGRQQDACDYAIKNNYSVSRKHATLSQKGVQVYISDNDSLNGTKVDGVKLTPGEPVKLMSGQVVEIGTEEFRFFAPGGDG